MESPGSAKGFFVTLPVIYIECFYEKIYEVHCSKRGHQGILSNIWMSYWFEFILNEIKGIRKTSEQINIRFHGCTESIVAHFRKTCFVCNLSVIQQSQPRLKPIISTEIFERAQLDLIDMRNKAVSRTIISDSSGPIVLKYNWIGHMIDHSGQFHVLWAQYFKTGKKTQI